MVFVLQKKKKFKKIPKKKNLFKKVPWPHQNAEVVCFGHMVVADCATFTTWHAT